MHQVAGVPFNTDEELECFVVKSVGSCSCPFKEAAAGNKRRWRLGGTAKGELGKVTESTDGHPRPGLKPCAPSSLWCGCERWTVRRLAGKWVHQTHGVGGELWMPRTAGKVNKRVLAWMKLFLCQRHQGS